MTTRKRFSFFSKNDHNKPVQKEIPHSIQFQNEEHNEEFGGLINTQKLNRSQSGRIKVFNKKRLAISTETYTAPEDQAHSAPVMSITKPMLGLTSRGLMKSETVRLSRSLQFTMNSSNAIPRDTSLSRNSSAAEQPDSDNDFPDEIF